VLFVIKYFTKYTLCCRTHLTTLSHLLAVGGVTEICREIWFADSFRPFEDNDVTHFETGSSIASPQQLRRVQEGQKQSYHRNRHVILHQQPHCINCQMNC